MLPVVHTKSKRRIAAEIIAMHYGMDLADMADYRYQPTRYSQPAIYSLGPTDYVAAPSSGKMPEGYCDLEWRKIGEEYGRSIFAGSQPQEL